MGWLSGDHHTCVIGHPEIFRYGDGSIGGNISYLGDSGSFSYEWITQHTEIPRMYRGLVLPGVVGSTDLPENCLCMRIEFISDDFLFWDFSSFFDFGISVFLTFFPFRVRFSFSPPLQYLLRFLYGLSGLSEISHKTPPTLIHIENHT